MRKNGVLRAATGVKTNPQTNEEVIRLLRQQLGIVTNRLAAIGIDMPYDARRIAVTSMVANADQAWDRTHRFDVIELRVNRRESIAG